MDGMAVKTIVKALDSIAKSIDDLTTKMEEIEEILVKKGIRLQK